jgi:antitoxin component of RelBE/YafQ-DinJ toxin-antitoxin module
MDKKLTLSLDKTIIESAKNYAKSNNISLSKLIESYLTTLTKQKRNPVDITPLVESLSGVISLDKDFDVKDSYSDYLIEKYK